MSDRYTLGLRRTAQVIRAEKTIEAAAYKALRALGETAKHQLAHSGMNPDVLDARHPAWQRQVDEHLIPAIAAVFRTAYDQGTITAAAQPVEAPAGAASDLAADRYLTQYARNRLVGVSDTVYAQIVAALREGRGTGGGESIPQLAARVDALLDDTQRWRNRAVTIARTEAIGAHNAGYHAAAADNAALMGYTGAQVVKEWLATHDARTRPSHQDASGQTVTGIGTPFSVGGSPMAYPGDPAGPAEEVVNCRCTTLYHYPGDPGYPVAASASLYRMTPDSLHTDGAPHQEEQMTATPPEGPAPDEATEAQTTVVVVALPAADDPCQTIGEEQKHATVLYFGGIPGSGDDTENPGLTPDFLTALTQLVSDTAAATPVFTEPVTGVESLGDDGARVWMLGGDGLAPLRDALTTGPIPDVLGQVQQYPSYTPHVTIAYPVSAPADAEDETDDDLPDSDDTGPGAVPPDTDLLDPATEDAAAAVQSITFDRLACWIAGEQTEYPLAAAAPASINLTTRTEGSAVHLYLNGKQVGTVHADEGATVQSARLVAADVPAPGEAPAGGPVLAQDIPADGEPFYGIIWPEDVMSGDARGIASGGTTWRDLPLPLMAQDATEPGHDGAVRAGRIDTIERDETTYSVPVVRFTGVWDISPIAQETARQVDARIVRGISVDGDAVTVELHGSDGGVIDPMTDDFPADGVVVEVATAARVSGGTVCSIPAFHQAYIANGTLADRADPEPGWNEDGTPKDGTLNSPAPAAEVEPVAASAAPAWTLVASAETTLPVWPYADFTNPGLTEPTRLTVTDDGRVFGHLATWGVCHIGIDGICQEPPVSATNYAYFAKGAVDTDEGLVPVGPLTMDTGHAAMSYGARAAAAHYDNTGSAVADVAMGQDGVGIWFAGRLRPGTTPEQVYVLRATGAVSGDWRDIGTGLELVAALVVNTPGFPIPAPAVAASGQRAMALVASGIIKPDEVPTQAPYDRATVVREVVAHLDRRTRVEAAATRLRAQRAATARRRLTASRRRRVIAAASRLNMKG